MHVGERRSTPMVSISSTEYSALENTFHNRKLSFLYLVTTVKHLRSFHFLLSKVFTSNLQQF